MKHLIKKEITHYFANPIGYIVVILFAVFVNFLFTKDLFLMGSLSMKQFFATIPWLLMVFLPAIAMRQIAEEKRVGTIDVLKTLPITTSSIVFAKFIATLLVVALAMALTLSIPISINMFASKYNVGLYLPEVLVGYFGVLLLAAAELAICIYFSSLTTNQVVAFLTSAIVLFILTTVGGDFFSNFIPGFMEGLVTSLSPGYHFEAFVKGVINLKSLVYFASTTFIFVFLTVAQLDNRS